MGCSPNATPTSTPAHFTFTHSTPAVLVPLLFLKLPDTFVPLAWNAFPRQPYGPLVTFTCFLSCPILSGAYAATSLDWTGLPSPSLALLSLLPWSNISFVHNTSPFECLWKFTHCVHGLFSAPCLECNPHKDRNPCLFHSLMYFFLAPDHCLPRAKTSINIWNE